MAITIIKYSIMSKIYALLLVLAGLFIAAPASAQLYDVRPGEVNYNKSPRAALKVQVDGKASDVRDFFQTWMKSSYNIKFKNGGLLGLGKSDVLEARQTPASTISGKLLDLYARMQRGSDLEFRSSFNSPSLLFDAVAIAGK